MGSAESNSTVCVGPVAVEQWTKMRRRLEDGVDCAMVDVAACCWARSGVDKAIGIAYMSVNEWRASACFNGQRGEQTGRFRVVQQDTTDNKFDILNKTALNIQASSYCLNMARLLEPIISKRASGAQDFTAVVLVGHGEQYATLRRSVPPCES
jgi:hypothetical protein